MDTTSLNTLLASTANMLVEFKRNVMGYYGDSSLADVTRLARVEPLTILSRDAASLDCTTDVMLTTLNLFSAYYLQAITLLTRVNSVEIVRALDKLNPNRDASGFLLVQENLTHNQDNYRWRLPVIGSKLSLEDVNTDNHKELNDVAQLSVGKLLNVEMCYGEEDNGGKKAKTVVVPVSVRLIASIIPSNSIIKIIASKTDDISMIERYHSWRAGRIQFIRDFVLAQDLIDESRKLSMSDDTNTVMQIMQRVANAKKYGFLTKNPSLVTASNIFVMTKTEAAEIENKFGGKLSNPNTLKKAFENTYAMILVVIDSDWEKVTFYIRGSSSSSTLSFAQLKNLKSKGPNIMDMLKTMSMGLPPSF